ncbi:uncharacterized protein GGS22DRAFT_63741 [Annulohypoxylon maeteangense]|uniref:uncharacterized protein n=1 Tax=Annulohypoxylon maeteangense TaxID=1927788 RepID=UPI002008AF28|nr:uncharacterized protein GGS22DRAFT_63741 [Annulohypoxylon maeteangense]KAI0888850.1 hypothetical protein GGS22DRAFT_63741 [Annulohypoxylon maeteangense]
MSRYCEILDEIRSRFIRTGSATSDTRLQERYLLRSIYAWSDFPSSLAIILSACTSLSSGVLLGPQLASCLGSDSPASLLASLLRKTSNTLPDTVSIPKTAKLALALHCYSMTTLSLYKTMGDCRRRKLTSGVILLVGLAALSSSASSEGTWVEKEAEVITVLPLLMSLSLLLTLGFYSLRQQNSSTPQVHSDKG